MLNIYGIKNCDTMKKAFRWLDEHQVEYQFHDYKKEGVNAELAAAWVAKLGWEAVINKRGTTWRKLTDDVKDNMSESNAVTLMLEQPSLIKRPLIVKNEEVYLGFNAEHYAQTLI
ncbi:ArsC family reductase [Marinomonas posidonica]|uniref:ArsC family protein n=1 Tax=Marinomonas posidonica (strain CECT 7376 / NCIMB 14433 / IVIA-Po-181) TaxID=491952 RepID=F6CY34_MARPP|nr:ArsC family reductase [Marinomonas posidonica]AEF55666.1 ArsC family protein [Marinomonas posidonica IVIA-Po-181]